MSIHPADNLCEVRGRINLNNICIPNLDLICLALTDSLKVFVVYVRKVTFSTFSGQGGEGIVTLD